MKTGRLALWALLLGLAWNAGCADTLPGVPSAEDPVCKREVPKVDWAISREYCGHRFYFDSDACARKFDADPDAYARPYEARRIDEAWWDEDTESRFSFPDLPDR
jgi:YHS domain-containing protein